MSAQKIGTPGGEQDTMQQAGSAALHELRALQDAISRSQAMIEFSPDGTVVRANDNFCAALGYTQEEVIGQHHSLFVDPEYARSADYRQFWDRLRGGEFIRDEFRRVGKGGREVWILATYNPVLDDAGKVSGIVKFATDITEEKQRRNATSGKMRALDLSMAIIEFDLEGRILAANDNFLSTMGYRLDEIIGRPHAMFVDPEHAASPEYRQFWTRLRAGEFISDEFQRFGKDGKVVWIQASYNPVNGTDGRPASVIKFASDITARKEIEHKAMILAGATDNADACLMMCDADLNITYCNPAVTEMLRARQTELRTVWRDLDVDHLIGRSIDGFHTDPAHQRAILQNPARLPFRAEIRVGGLDFGLTATAVLDDQGRYCGNMVEWQDLTEKKTLEREAQVALREAQIFKAAVGSASTALMFCDEDFNVSYCNASVMDVLRPRTEALRSVWPGFDLDTIIGRPIDGFHKHPEHQRRVLRDPSRLPFRSDIKVAGLEFRLTASAVYDDQNRIVGNMVEWVDITEEKAAEREIQRIIEAAGHGELGERLDPAQFSGFTKTLAGGLNQLLDTVNGPVQEAVRCLGALSEGDLTAVMEGEQGGAFAELRESYTTAVGNLTETIRGIQEAAHTVSGAAAEISQGNLDLSQRTEEQSSSLEETASSMEEITSTVKQTADNAGQANQLASSARDRAEQGGTVVADAMEAMKEINAASQKIADIIGVIDEIAFQTNLLALNAAVEAARAGEQGRGFAVVASEVRNLAQRSAAEAKTIRGLIKDSVNKVGEGSRLVDQSGERLREIVEAVASVSDIVAEITAAAKEQSSGIEQINQTVTQLDEMTQQNASLVEESAAAAKSLEEQASDMSGLVSSFRITGGSLTPVRPGRDDHAVAGRSPAPRGSRPTASRAPARSAPAPRGRPVRQDDGDDWSEF